MTNRVAVFTMSKFVLVGKPPLSAFESFGERLERKRIDERTSEIAPIAEQDRISRATTYGRHKRGGGMRVEGRGAYFHIIAAAPLIGLRLRRASTYLRTYIQAA